MDDFIKYMHYLFYRHTLEIAISMHY